MDTDATSKVAGLSERARGHVARGDHHLALPLAHRAADWALVADIIEADWPRLFMKHYDALREAYADTPAEAFRGHPAARAVREMCFPVAPPVPGRGPAELPADQATLVELAAGPEAVDTLLASFAGMIAMRLREQWQRGCDQAARLSVVLDEAHTRHFDEVARRIPGIELQMGFTFLMAGDTTGALRHMQRAHKNADLDELGYIARDAAGKIALVHAARGDIVQAARWLTASDHAGMAETVMTPHIESGRHSARALIAVAQGDPDAALRAHTDLDGTLIEEEFWALRLHALARIGLLRGDVLGMQRLVEHGRAELPYAREPSPYMESLLLADAVDLHIALGAGSRAHEILADTHLDAPLLDICRARLQLYRDDPRGALQCAHAALGVEDAGPRVAIEASLLAAVAHHQIGQKDDAATTLRLAVERASSSGFAAGLAAVPAERLAALALDVGQALPDGVPAFFGQKLTIVELTERERAVLGHLAEGLPLTKIAEADFVSVNTVKTQVRSIYRKLDATGRDEALQRARAEGLV